MVFGRKWRLYLSQPSIRDRNYVESVVESYSNYRARREDAILLQDPLHINATVKHSLEPYSEEGSEEVTIDLYNLSENTLNKIKGGETVFLYAGYSSEGEDLNLVYTGSLTEVVSWSEGADKIVRLHTSPLPLNVRTIQFNRSYSEATVSYLSIVNDMISVLNSNGIPATLSHTYIDGGSYTEPSWLMYKKFLDTEMSVLDYPVDFTSETFGVRLDSIIHQPYFFRGNIFNSLSLVCKDLGFVWYVVRGIVQIQPKKYPLLQEYRTINDVNIVGNVKPYKEFGDETEALGVELSVFLDPTMGLDTLIRLSKKGYEGTWGVSEVSHELSYQGGDWVTKLKLVPASLSTIPRDLGRVAT